jgi:hypothetical protein
MEPDAAVTEVVTYPPHFKGTFVIAFSAGALLLIIYVVAQLKQDNDKLKYRLKVSEESNRQQRQAAYDDYVRAAREDLEKASTVKTDENQDAETV